MTKAIGSRYNTDGTSDHGVSDDRHLIHMDRDGLTFNPDIQITYTSGDFTLSALWGEVKIVGGPSSRIISHDRGVTIEQQRLVRHAAETGQRFYSWNEMIADFSI